MRKPDEIRADIEQAKRDLSRAEKDYALSMQEWANSDGLAEIEWIESINSDLRILENELKYATGELDIADDIPW